MANNLPTTFPFQRSAAGARCEKFETENLNESDLMKAKKPTEKPAATLRAGACSPPHVKSLNYFERRRRGGAGAESDFALAWNLEAKAQGWRSVAVMTKARLRHLRARLREEFFADNWRAALSAMAKNPFFKGENPRGWKASVDFFLRPDAVPKVMEGFYERFVAPAPKVRAQPDHSRGFFHDQEPEEEKPLTPEEEKKRAALYEEIRQRQAKFRLPPKAARPTTGGAL